MRVDFLQVVVGIIKANQRILIALRNNHQVGGNRWEFPGGKIERDESGPDPRPSRPGRGIQHPCMTIFTAWRS